MKNIHKKGFTLVELIVVIAILAILGTIAFITMQGYSRDSRDTVRISDMSKIKTTLELFQLDSGKYPIPTGGVEITYSGAMVWTQGTFGEITYKNVSKLDKIPKDPLIDTEYVYSTTNTRQEFQLGGIMEGDEVSFLPLDFGKNIGLEQVNASEKTARLKISGTYNGRILKVNTGSIDYVLAIPTIMTSSGTDLEIITQNNYLVYNGFKNLPFQYTGKYKLDGETNLNLVNSTELVVFNGELKTLSETTQEGIDARKIMLEKLQNAYNGTTIQNIGEIKTILETDTEDSKSTELLTTTIVSNNLGGSIVASGGSTVTYSNCTEQTIDDYNILQINHNSTYNAEKVINITQGTQTYKQTFTCDNGTYSKTGEEEILTPNCNTDYVASGNNCVLDTCNGTLPENAELNGTQGTATWSWSQTTSGVCKYKCMDGYDTASCSAKTKAVTQATHNSRTFNFTSFTLAYNSPQTKTSSPLAITNGTSTLTATFTLESDGTTVSLSEQSEDITCNAGFTNQSGACNDITPPTGGSFTINNNATSTNSTSVTLNITCPTDAAGSTPIQVAYGNTTNPTNWTTCTSSISHTLSDGDGTKTVYMRFRDSASIPNVTGEVSDGISLLSPRGEQLYTTPGTYSWTVPAGVTSVSVVCVGGGGKSTDKSGGGGLGWSNNLFVSFGQTYTVIVGGNNSDSSFLGVIGGGANTITGSGGTFTGQGGGNGGKGTRQGGGAGGYTGNGGDENMPGQGGGGAGGTSGGGSSSKGYAGGGGVGLFGQGPSGIIQGPGVGGGGGSGGENGISYYNLSGHGNGNYGGGGCYSSRAGGTGACRIIWPGNTRQFPSTDVGP